ncbi:MAG: T9SS type A sorting domain-containing protein [Rhodothermaceae bacterium]|nr:T9SS type A sorting domain-containing protein [Rhodothermaceae bacterium]
MRTAIVILLVFTFNALSCLNVHAQYVAKLVASDPGEGDLYGRTVSISGNYAIVGAWSNDDVGIFSGSAYIYKRDGLTWTHQEKLLASDIRTTAAFGKSVAIDRNYAVVGSDGHDAPVFNAGAAYVFVRDGETWMQQARLSASDVLFGTALGVSVAIEGEYVVVGSRAFAYVYKRNGETWTEQAKLEPAVTGNQSMFGASVAINGEYILVGAPRDVSADGRKSSIGAVHVFKRDGETWTEQIKLNASDFVIEDRFGTSIALEGTTAIIGAPGVDGNGTDTGAVYIFEREGEAWVEKQKLEASDGMGGQFREDLFGRRVSLEGTKALIGASSSDIGELSNAGAAYLFERDGGIWTEKRKIIAPDTTVGGGGLGADVSMDNGYLLIGASGAPAFEGDGAENNVRSGAAYVFFESDGTSQVATEKHPETPLLVESLQNYPNPFRTQTNITFQLNRSSTVKLEIYDLLGRKVSELINYMLPSGMHERSWDGTDRDGIFVPSGIYMYRLEVENASMTKMLSVIR